MNIKKVNLNLLIALDALLSERSVSLAAKKCFVTQAAMSNTLNQLRTVFDDPLFVRQSKGMYPTPRALELQPKITELMQQVEEIVSVNAFEPSHATQTFTLALADHGRFLILPKLVKRLQTLAPKVTLNTVCFDAGFSPMDFETKKIDLGIGIEMNDMRAFHCESLFKEGPVCISMSNKKLSLAAYRKASHVAVKYNPDTKLSFVDEILKLKEIERQVVTTASNLMTGLEIVANTKCIGTFPKRLCEYFQPRYQYHIQKAPFKIQSCDVQMVWHKRHETCLANQWLRQLIIDIACDEKVLGV